MTDDLLDEAEKFAAYLESHADDEPAHVANTDGETVRALVERVQQAEAERQEWADLWQKASMSVLTLQGDAKTLTRERDAAREDCNKNASNVRRLTLELHEARAKLDTVREVVDTLRNDCEYHESREVDAAEIRTVDGWRHVDDYAQDVLSILDGKRA